MIVNVERHGRNGKGRPDFLVLVFDDGTKIPLRRIAEMFNISRQTINTRLARGHTDPAIVLADGDRLRTEWRDILHQTPAAAPRGWGYAGRFRTETIKATVTRWREGRNDRA